MHTHQGDGQLDQQRGFFAHNGQCGHLLIRLNGFPLLDGQDRVHFFGIYHNDMVATRSGLEQGGVFIHIGRFAFVVRGQLHFCGMQDMLQVLLLRFVDLVQKLVVDDSRKLHRWFERGM